MNVRGWILLHIAPFVFPHVIRFTSPIEASPYPASTGITTKIGHKYVFMYLCMIKSFFFFSGLCPSVCVIDDGTLTRIDKRMLRNHVRNIHIIPKSAGQQEMMGLRQHYPYTYRYHQESHPDLYTHNTCVYDLIQLPAYEKFVVIDADIIFFRPPTEIIRWLTGDDPTMYFMSFPSRYAATALGWGRVILTIFANLWNSRVPPIFNDGIMCGYKSAFAFSRLEQSIKPIYKYGLEHSWISLVLIWSKLFIDISTHTQTPIHQLKSNRYRILTVQSPDTRNSLTKLVCMHYIGIFKDRYFPLDALRVLKKTKLFTSHYL